MNQTAKKKKINTDFHYYLLDFSYHGPRSNFGETPESNAGISTAEKAMEKIAAENNIEMQHAYTWPDGSLYKYIRTRGPCDKAKLRELFRAEADIRDKKKSKGFKISVVLSQITNEEHPFRLNGVRFFTVQELFDVPLDERNKLIKLRLKQKDAFYAKYSQARAACSTCRPGQLGCDACLKVLEDAEVKYNAWCEVDRPFKK